jgi:hypothetical protein
VSEFADVVATGETIRFTRHVGTIGRWYDGVCQPVGDDGFSVIFMEATERVLAQRRRDVLASLGERLRDLTDPAGVAYTACVALAEAPGVGLVGYGDVDPVAETVTVERDWTAEGVSSFVGTLRFRDFGSFVDDLKRGRTVIVRDCETAPGPATTPRR